MGEPFFFGIPLIAPASAGDWSRVDALFAATLRSLLAQSDRDFRVLIAGHEPPPSLSCLADDRVDFLTADWPPDPPSVANDDAGGKKWLIKQAVRGRGGGLLMFVDADDLVDADTVEIARRSIGRHERGGIVGGGFAIDNLSGRAVALPDPRLFGLAFHEICGSSTIGRLRPDGGDPFRELGWHRDWARSELVARLPLAGGYRVNTGESHSENHGPFADWRREFGRRVRQHGRDLAPAERQRLSIERRPAQSDAA